MDIKISEAIRILEEIKEKRGDLPIHLSNRYGEPQDYPIHIFSSYVPYIGDFVSIQFLDKPR